MRPLSHYTVFDEYKNTRFLTVIQLIICFHLQNKDPEKIIAFIASAILKCSNKENVAVAAQWATYLSNAGLNYTCFKKVHLAKNSVILWKILPASFVVPVFCCCAQKFLSGKGH